MKRKNSPSGKDQATSRYFRAVSAPKSPDAANHDIEGMTKSISQPRPRGSHVDPAPRSQHEVSDENRVTAQRSSPTPFIATSPESMQQVSEVRRVTAVILTFYRSYLSSNIFRPLFRRTFAHPRRPR
jgi:hypothetical protein